MAIELMWAVIAKDQELNADRQLIITDPAVPVIVPVEKREVMEKEGASILRMAIGHIVTVVCLYGGLDSQKFTISGSIVDPLGKSVYLPVKDHEWPTGEHHRRINIQFNGELAFSKSGVFKFNYLLDGRPLVSLPLPAYWEDEVPH